MNVTYYPAIRIIEIQGNHYTVSELEARTDRTRQETTIMNTARAIFEKRKKLNPLYVPMELLCLN